MSDLACAEDDCREAAVVGFNGKWLCLIHFNPVMASVGHSIDRFLTGVITGPPPEE